MRRFWPRRPLRRTGRGGQHRSGNAFQVLLSAVLGVGLALVLIHMFDAGVRPAITELSLAQATNAVVDIVDQAVADTLVAQAVAYDDMVSLQTDGSGHITALTSNTAEMNRLRTAIVGDIVGRIEMLTKEDLGIPIGNLTGLSTLSGKGAILPVQVLAVGTPTALFSNTFSQAGINQTCHRVMLDVGVDLALLIPGGTVNTSVNTHVCVAETVLVGEVPQTYLHLTPTQ